MKSEIDKNARKEEQFRKSESIGLRIIAIITAGLAIVTAITLLLAFKMRALKRRNRELYEIAHEKANAPADTEPMPVVQPDTTAEAATPPAESIKYAGSTLSREALEEILRSALSCLDKTEEFYSADFTLARLADMASTKTRYLSQAISEIDGRNFNAIVNERRIHEACRRFDDTLRYGHLTVEAVGQSVGFKSRSAFTDAFKKTAGMTPSAYARIARSKENA